MVQLVCPKVLAHNSLEAHWNTDESRFIKTFLTILGVTEILCSFKSVLEGKTCNKIPKSSRVLTKILANDFVLSDENYSVVTNDTVGPQKYPHHWK